jgi:hypothetical protein
VFAEAIGFIQACLQLLLHSQSNIERDRIHHFQQYVADHTINLGARNTLTDRLSVLNALTLAHVLGACSSQSHLIAQRHAPAALATNNQTLQ